MDYEYKIQIQGHDKDEAAAQIRFPVDDPEGVLYQTDISGNAISYAVSQNHIEVLDLLSEGLIDGLVSGYWTPSGNAGSIGYAQNTFTSYNTPSGLSSSTNWLRSIFWNQVQLIDSNGQFNYQNVDVSFTRGFPNGAILNTTSPDLVVVRPIGERLRGSPTTEKNAALNADADFAKIYSIYSKDVKQLKVNIRVNQLSQNNTTKEEYGDVEKTKVSYQIYKKKLFSTPGKIDNYVLAATDSIEGKITYGYIKTTTIVLATAADDSSNQIDFVGWQIKVIRTTPETYQSTIRNQTFVDSIVEISGDTFSYPSSAIVRQKFNAEYFAQLPARAFHTRGLQVLVPSNYNVNTKAYTGDWDGTFKDDKEWTDNPVWCYFDLLTNKRYGLGNYIETDSIDKWTLYEIAQYCDTLVPDGFGNVEPRLTCNLYISSREEAFKVIGDLASIFRGITYYAGGTIQASYDSPKDTTYLFTNANVENGSFNYSSSSKKARHTVAIVRYNDKNNFYQPAMEYVEDQEGLKRYGIREIEVTAFGCTSRGQAIRFGRWILLSERLETESVSFVTDLQGVSLRPGDVFAVSDQYQNVKRYGGRTYQVANTPSTATVVLDTALSLEFQKTYNFNLASPTYDYDTTQTTLTSSTQISGIHRAQHQILSFQGSVATLNADNRTEIAFSTPFNFTDYVSGTQMVWTIEMSAGSQTSTTDYETISGQNALFRVINIKEDEKNKYSIGGLQYDYAKYAQIDSGLAFEQPVAQYKLQPPPPAALLLATSQPTTNTKSIDYSFISSNLTGVSNYYVYAKKDPFVASDVNSNNLISVLPYNVTSGSFLPPTEGNYYFRIYSNNSYAGASSSYAQGNVIVQNTNSLLDLTISSLRLADDTATNAGGGSQTGIYSGNSPTFAWQVGYNATSFDPSDFSYRLTVRKPSSSNTPDPEIYYALTGYWPSDPGNPTYQFPIATNSALTNGPYRNYDFVVEAGRDGGSSSAGGDYVNMLNASGIQDSLFSNSLGYDIIYVTNPPPTGVRLTPAGETQAASLLAGTTYTSQWLNSDGSTVVKFNTGVIPFSDIVGGYLYTNPTGNIANIYMVGTSRTQFLMPAESAIFPFTVTVPTQITNTGTWAALALYDQFDEGHLNDTTISGLYLSNTTYVRKLGDFTEASGLLQAQITTLQSGTFPNPSGYLQSQIDALQSGTFPNLGGGIVVNPVGGPITTVTGDPGVFVKWGQKTLGNSILSESASSLTYTGTNLIAKPNTAYNASPAANYGFTAQYDASGNYITMGQIQFGKQNTTDGNTAGYASIQTRNNGGNNTERVRIDPNGVFITGSTSLSVQNNLHVGFGVSATGYTIKDPIGNSNKDTRIYAAAGGTSGIYQVVSAQISGVDYIMFTKRM